MVRIKMYPEYHEYWGLTEPVFENVPDPEFLYKFPQHKEALERLIYAVKALVPNK